MYFYGSAMEMGNRSCSIKIMDSIFPGQCSIFINSSHCFLKHTGELCIIILRSLGNSNNPLEGRDQYNTKKHTKNYYKQNKVVFSNKQKTELATRLTDVLTTFLVYLAHA